MHKASRVRVAWSHCAAAILFGAFGIGVIAFVRMGAIPRAAPTADFTGDFGVNEWMIDYSGGFVRRGLFGEVLHFLWDSLALHPATVAVVVSIAAYVALCAYAIKASANVLPKWCLFTTALFASPLYMRTVIRKDVTVLLILVACVKVAQSSMRRSTQFVALNGLLALGLLLQETFAFFAVPAVIVIVGLSHADRAPSLRATHFLRSVWRGMLFCSPALLVLFLVVLAHGSPESAQATHDSWRSAFLSSGPWPERPGGSIMWIGLSVSDALAITWRALTAPVLGVPSWMMVAANSAAGALLIRAYFRRYASTRHALVFQSACIFQFLACMPLFLGALDSGRWLTFVLLSTFVLTIECHVLLSRLLLGAKQDESSAADVSDSRHSAWLPTVSLLYGICAVTWSVQAFVMTTPLGSLWSNLNRLGVLRYFS